MDGKERTLCALNFEPTDRLPIVGGRIRHVEFLTEVAQITVDQFWENPRRVAIEVADKMGADAIWGPTLPLKDSDIGAATHIHNTQTRFRSPEDVVKYVDDLPPLSAIESGFDYGQSYDHYTSQVKCGQDEAGHMLFIPFTGFSVPFHHFYEFFGLENFFMAIALYPDAIRKLFDFEAERKALENKAIADATAREDLVKFIWGGEDICSNQGPMISLRSLDSLYFPSLKKALIPLRDAGIKIIWHSDGNIMPIVDRLLNVAGVDGFQGLQEETGVDIEVLAEKPTSREEKTLIVGGVNVPTIVFGAADDVEAEVERCAQIAEKRGGGLLLCPSSSCGPDVKKDNIYAKFNYARCRTLRFNQGTEQAKWQAESLTGPI